MPVVHHRYVTVAGHQLFFREAGDPDAPVLLLLQPRATQMASSEPVRQIAFARFVMPLDQLPLPAAPKPGIITRPF